MKRLIKKAGKNITMTVYHGTNAKFTEFQKSGDKLTSLGLGFYFTPNLTKAEQYGDIIMTVELSFNNLLDWNNLTKEDKEKIVVDLEPCLSAEAIAGYGTVMEEKFSPDQKNEAMEFFDQKVDETKNYFHSRAKAKVKKDKQNNFIITWMEASLENASNEDLLALAQEYHNDIAYDLGYDGVMYGDEVVAFNQSSINVVDYGWE